MQAWPAGQHAPAMHFGQHWLSRALRQLWVGGQQRSPQTCSVAQHLPPTHCSLRPQQVRRSRSLLPPHAFSGAQHPSSRVQILPAGQHSRPNSVPHERSNGQQPSSVQVWSRDWQQTPWHSSRGSSSVHSPFRQRLQSPHSRPFR